MSITASLVVTTIFDPVVLEGYFQNFEQYGHLDDVDIYVIPDRKTPAQSRKPFLIELIFRPI
jgi:hypothetical protein